MTRSQTKHHLARVLDSHNDNGSVRCDIRVLDSHGRNETHAYVRTLHPGMMIVPEPGWVVTVESHTDGQKYITGVACGPEYIDEHSKRRGFRKILPSEEGEPQRQYQITKEMEPGTVVWQLDRQSGMVWRWNEDEKTWDLELHAGGDITVSAGGSFEQKTGATMPSEEDDLTKNPPQ